MKRIKRFDSIAITIVVLTIVFVAVSVMFTDISDIGETSNGVLVPTPTTPTPTPTTPTPTPTPTPAPIIEVKSPVNLKLEDDILTWDAVDEADGYSLRINRGISIPSESNSFNLRNYFDQLRTGVNTIDVVTIKGDARSAVSEFSYVLSIRPPSNIKISASSSSVQISWDQVQNASAYVVIFDNNHELQTSTNSLRLAFSEIENNTAVMSATDIRVFTVDSNGNRSPISDKAELSESLVAPTIRFRLHNDNADTIEWDNVRNASYYTIFTNDTSNKTTRSNIGIRSLDIKPGNHTYRVTANVLGFSSEPSNIIEGFWAYELTLPSLPLSVCTSCNSTSSSSTYTLTEITYDYSLGVDIYLTGRLNESARGPNTAVTGRIQYRILDSEGFVITTSSFSIPSLLPGEGFRNARSYWSVMSPNLPYGRYRLDIIAIQN